jgi:hypothetical protein
MAINKSSFDCIVFVHMLKADGLADRRFVMNSLAAVSVAACPDFVEEWTVDFVHLCSVDLRQSICHYKIIIDLTFLYIFTIKIELRKGSRNRF